MHLAALLDALRIGRVGVYGYHTGAAIGAAFALHHPGRAAFAIFNGLPSFDGPERADLLAHYLPPFEPRWDGSHLAWLWARLREQTIHFPGTGHSHRHGWTLTCHRRRRCRQWIDIAASQRQCKTPVAHSYPADAS